VFAGQADPHDLSHFTIQFEWHGRRSVVDGWLHDDDTVSMRVREPIAAKDGSDASAPFDHRQPFDDAPNFDLEAPRFSHRNAGKLADRNRVSRANKPPAAGY